MNDPLGTIFTCTNEILKVQPDHIGGLSQKQLDHIAKVSCGRPMLAVPSVEGDTVLAVYCEVCDGPLHEYTRGPHVLSSYLKRHSQIETSEE